MLRSPASRAAAAVRRPLARAALLSLGAAALTAPASAQDGAAPDSAARRTAPGFGTAPADAGPKHALWVRGLSMEPGRGFTLGPGIEAEYERRLTSNVTLGGRVRRLARNGYVGVLSAVTSREEFDADLRLRYYVGGQPMRGWWVGAGAGFAHVRGSTSYTAGEFAGTGPYRFRADGYSLSAEAGYTWLLGDGARNRLGITLSIGAQQYYFPGERFKPHGTFPVMTPRLSIGWTF